MALPRHAPSGYMSNEDMLSEIMRGDPIAQMIVVCAIYQYIHDILEEGRTSPLGELIHPDAWRAGAERIQGIVRSRT